MNLEEILSLIAFTKQNLSTLKTKLKYYLVVMLGYRQFQQGEISRLNIDLFKFPDIFAPGQHTGRLQKRFFQFNALEESAEKIKKKIESQRKKDIEPSPRALARLNKANRLAEAIKSDLEKRLDTILFVRPQIDLRFDHLDIEEIQAIKEFPYIKALGRTDPSPASIRVVAG